jgi:AMP phosphorylase
MLLPSIMSKKKAVGANYVVIDIPTGRGTKIKTMGDANLLAKDFILIGKKLGMSVQCAVTYGEQPVGHAIGPALEAREALEVLMRKKNVPDLIDKACHVAGILFEMTGMKNGEQIARDIIKSGKAEAKLREIIGLQSGNPKIKPEDMEIGQHGLDCESKKPGIVLWIDNASLVEIARAAGSPKDKGAGIILHKKLGDNVAKGERLFTVYAEKQQKLERVRQLMDEGQSVGVGERTEMLMSHVKEVPVHKKTFILER